MNEVTSLYELASHVFVRHVNLLRVHTEAIPPVLYQSLLSASLKTDRILSVRHLFLSWPLQSLSLVGFKYFTEKHAVMLAHCLEAGCNKLCEVNLTGCNIGVHGTTLLLMFVAGRPLPKVSKYCTNKNTTTVVTKDGNRLPNRLSITADCYINVNNCQLFLDICNAHCSTLHDFNVSYFNAIELGRNRIIKVLKKLGIFQAQSVLGLDLQMNGLQLFRTTHFQLLKIEIHIHKWCRTFSNLQYLNLSMNLIEPHVLVLILQNISACLTHLLLNSCCFQLIPNSSSFYFDQMAELFCMQKLEYVELEDSHLQKVGPGFMKFLRNCSGTLSFLNLEKNYLTDEFLPTILQLLERPFTLQTLRIGQNRFSFNAEKLIFRKEKLGEIIKGYKYPKLQMDCTTH